MQATRERFTEYIAVMKKALRDAAEASAAHSAGIQLLNPSSNESAQAHPPPGMLPSTSLRPMHLAVVLVSRPVPSWDVGRMNNASLCQVLMPTS